MTAVVEETSPSRKLANELPQEPNDGEFGWLVVKLLKLNVPARPPLKNRLTPDLPDLAAELHRVLAERPRQALR